MIHILLLAQTIFLANAGNKCSKSVAKQIIAKWTLVQKCAGSNSCIDYDDGNNNGRRRLNDNDNQKTVFQTYSCYCKNCEKRMTTLRELCNSCDAINYVYCAVNDNGEEECQQNEGGLSFYQQYCMLDSRVVMAHSDSFCEMMTTASRSCLKQVEYMVNPPEEQNDRRRRLNDNNEDGNPIQAIDIANCWKAPISGGQSYENHDYCNWVCNTYGNYTYSYMSTDDEGQASQSCGVSLGYYDSETVNDFLPSPVTKQGIMCTPAVCSSNDLMYIMDYVTKMSAYGSLINFCGEEGGEGCGEQGGNNNNQEENQNYCQDDQNNNNNNNNGEAQAPCYTRKIIIPEVRGSWQCDPDAAGGAGEFENEAFPSECEESTPTPTSVMSTNDGKYTTAAVFAVVCGIGMAVFMGLFVYYYRQFNDLRTGKTHQKISGGYQSTNAAGTII